MISTPSFLRMRPTNTSMVLRVAVEVLVVEMLDQFGARHHPAGVVHQVGQQPVFVGGELHRRAVDRDAPGAAVEPYRAAQELALGVADRTAQQRPDARQHLLEMEGLRHIVVGAGVEALHLVAPAVARGEQQHRHGAAGAPPCLQHRDAVHLGQADVEDDGVIGLGLAEIMALLAVEGAVHHVAGIGQRGGELAVEIGIVLDHEEAHSGFSRAAAGTARSAAALYLPLRQHREQGVFPQTVDAAHRAGLRQHCGACRARGAGVDWIYGVGVNANMKARLLLP